MRGQGPVKAALVMRSLPVHLRKTKISFMWSRWFASKAKSRFKNLIVCIQKIRPQGSMVYLFHSFILLFSHFMERAHGPVPSVRIFIAIEWCLIKVNSSHSFITSATISIVFIIPGQGEMNLSEKASGFHVLEFYPRGSQSNSPLSRYYHGT